MKRKIAALLCALLLLSALLCACGESSQVVGTWYGQLDLTPTLHRALEIHTQLGDHVQIEKITLEATVVFRKNGTYSLTVSDEGLEETLQRLHDQWETGIRSYVEELLEKQKLDISVDAFLQLSGTDVAGLLDQMIDEKMLRDVASELTRKGDYKVRGDKLYLAEDEKASVSEDSYCLFTLEEDVLTLTQYKGKEPSDALSVLCPMVFTKAG